MATGGGAGDCTITWVGGGGDELQPADASSTDSAASDIGMRNILSSYDADCVTLRRQVCQWPATQT